MKVRSQWKHPQNFDGDFKKIMVNNNLRQFTYAQLYQGRIQDLTGGGVPDRDRPKTAILGPQFCRILVLGPHFWWSGGGPVPRAPPGSAPVYQLGKTH